GRWHERGEEGVQLVPVGVLGRVRAVVEVEVRGAGLGGLLGRRGVGLDGLRGVLCGGGWGAGVGRAGGHHSRSPEASFFQSVACSPVAADRLSCPYLRASTRSFIGCVLTGR